MPLQKSIFLGITPAACRSFIAEEIKKHDPQHVYFPCAGRFTVPEVLARMNFGRERIFTSDICIFSSVIGYLADPALDYWDLQVKLPDDIPHSPLEPCKPIEHAAALFTYLQYRQIKPTSIYGENTRREMAARWLFYVDRTQSMIDSIVTALRGIHYEIRDMWDVLAEASADEGSVLYCSVPSYDGGYTKMYEGIEWNAPTIAEFDPTKLIAVLGQLRDFKCRAYLYMTFDRTPRPGRLAECPEGWKAVFSSMQNGRHSVIITNGTPERSYAPQKVEEKPTRRFPIYNDEEITAESAVQFVHVDRDTCLYYRDLFVHKLGTTDAECHLLMLIDGRVTTALGLTTDKLCRFASDYVNEVFGISVTSKRYARLGKLFMLALTSGSFRTFLLNGMAKGSLYGIRHAKGIRTSSIITGHEGKTDRSVMKLVEREDLPDGRRKVVYQGEFRPDTWADVIALWLKKWGSINRLSKDSDVASTSLPA